MWSAGPLRAPYQHGNRSVVLLLDLSVQYLPWCSITYLHASLLGDRKAFEDGNDIKIVHGPQPVLSTTCHPLCDLTCSGKDIQCSYFQDLNETWKSTLVHFDIKCLLERHPAITLPKISEDFFFFFFAREIVRHLQLEEVVTRMVEEWGTLPAWRANILPIMEATFQHEN